MFLPVLFGSAGKWSWGVQNLDEKTNVGIFAALCLCSKVDIRLSVCWSFNTIFCIGEL
jgi:hypothetical protein